MNKLINISEATSIAIHSLAIISRTDEVINAQYIAELTGFSKNHISKVLQLLVKQGYILSTRGPKGGFEGSDHIKSIKLLEVYELIDGKINTDYCHHHTEMCPFEDCEMSDVISELTSIFAERFGNKTIGELRFKIN